MTVTVIPFCVSDCWLVCPALPEIFICSVIRWIMGILSMLQVISPIFPLIDLPTFNIYIHQERLKVKKWCGKAPAFGLTRIKAHGGRRRSFGRDYPDKTSIYADRLMQAFVIIIAALGCGGPRVFCRSSINWSSQELRCSVSTHPPRQNIHPDLPRHKIVFYRLTP